MYYGTLTCFRSMQKNRQQVLILILKKVPLSSTGTSNMETTVKDNFEVYYREKLWEMIPAIYRHEDGIGDQQDVLRALIEVIAGQAAIMRRSQDRLWDDQFIDLCDDWAVPYI